MPRVLIAGIGFFLGAGILVVMAVRQEGIPTVSASQLNDPKYAGEEVFLDVKVTEILQAAKPSRFRVLGRTGGSEPVLVETDAVLSDTFGVGSDLRIKGVYDSKSRRFAASYVDTKCPSKYEGAKEGAPAATPVRQVP